jgi:hypothetical protein
VVELILPSGEAPDVAVRFCPSHAYNQWVLTQNQV